MYRTYGNFMPGILFNGTPEHDAIPDLYVIVEDLLHSEGVAADRVEEVEEFNPKFIFNDPTTIMIVNGTKFISTATDEAFDKEKGVLMCLAKFVGFTYSDIKAYVDNGIVQTPKTKKRVANNASEIDQLVNTDVVTPPTVEAIAEPVEKKLKHSSKKSIAAKK